MVHAEQFDELTVPSGGTTSLNSNIDTGDIDLSISPTWTSTHTFDSGWIANADSNVEGSILRVKNPNNSPSGSLVSLSSPQGAIGMTITEGDGSGNELIRYDLTVSSETLSIRNNNDSTKPFKIDSNGKAIFNENDIEGEGSNSALEMREHASISDTGSVQISRDASVHGYAMVQDTTNTAHTLVRFDGSTGNVTIVDQDGSHFTTTSGNGGTVNIYWDGSQYTLENQTGSSATISAEFMKA